MAKTKTKQKTLPVKISMWLISMWSRTHPWTPTDTDSKGMRLDRTKGEGFMGPKSFTGNIGVEVLVQASGDRITTLLG